MEACLKLSPLYAIVDRETLDARGIAVRAFAEELRDGGVRLVQYRDKKNGPREAMRAAGEIAEVFADTGAMLVMNDRADLAALLSHSPHPSREVLRDEWGTQNLWGVHVGQGDLPVEAVRRVLGDGGSRSSREKLRDEWGTPCGGSLEKRQKRERSGRKGYAEDAARVSGVGEPHPSRETLRDEWGTRAYAGAPGEIQGSLHYAAAKYAAAPVEMTVSMVGVSTHDVEQVAAAENSAASYVAVGPVFATASKRNAEPVVGLEGVRAARGLTQRPLVAIGGITLENARSVREAGADSVAVIGGLFVAGRSVAEVARDFLARLG